MRRSRRNGDRVLELVFGDFAELERERLQDAYAGRPAVGCGRAGHLAIGLDWRQSGVLSGVLTSETSVRRFTLWLFTRGKWKAAQV